MSCTPLVWVVEQFSLEFTSMLILSLSCYDQNSISILMCGHFFYRIRFLFFPDALSSYLHNAFINIQSSLSINHFSFLLSRYLAIRMKTTISITDYILL